MVRAYGGFALTEFHRDSLDAGVYCPSANVCSLTVAISFDNSNHCMTCCNALASDALYRYRNAV